MQRVCGFAVRTSHFPRRAQRFRLHRAPGCKTRKGPVDSLARPSILLDCRTNSGAGVCMAARRSAPCTRSRARSTGPINGYKRWPALPPRYRSSIRLREPSFPRGQFYSSFRKACQRVDPRLHRSYFTGLWGRQKGSAAAMKRMGTSLINVFSHSAQYFIPACSETTWPKIISAFFFPEAIVS